MFIPRIFLPQPLTVGDWIDLDSDTHHRLVTVLRLKSAAKIVVFNGDGGEFDALLDLRSNKHAMIQVLAYRDVAREVPIKLELVQSIARSERMDFTLQKSVELGVHAITPVFTANSRQKPWSPKRLHNRLQHWRSIIISACEQSGRCRLPVLHNPCDFTAWFRQTQQQNEKRTYPEARYVLDPSAGISLFSHLCEQRNTRYTAVTLLIGPESGLTTAEVEHAGRHGFVRVSLGPRILRTETAAIAALAVVCQITEDLDSKR